MNLNFNVDSDIRKAETLPAIFYKDPELFEIIKKKIFLRTWHWVGDENLILEKKSLYPLILLEGYLDEPLLLSRTSSNNIKCLSNVCTHRGNLLVLKPSNSSKIRCMYHGRRFKNDGKFEFMPDFEKTKNFPRDCDNLHAFLVKSWNKLLFVGFNPIIDIDKVVDIMDKRIGFLPFSMTKFDSSLSQDFKINAHWALYCDNYLEGFHVPFVHKDLNEILDCNSYETEIYDHCNLQIGYSNNTDDCFIFPKNHVDYGKNIAAYYFWIFPNMMFNFYPWGLSINIVKPINLKLTEVEFRSYVFDKTKLNKGASGDLGKVEKEDEFVVQNVQKGINSSFYKSGRYSATKEKGVHHFHHLMSKLLKS
ncbi:aromatic ring-hydroxylating dioxygenase subunit alpha [Flavobacteriaceae bacterium]|nr:aromatic ring-hydroxylating dioxygenase subunit alpha [Flavobacteriaceae bacterium]